MRNASLSYANIWATQSTVRQSFVILALGSPVRASQSSSMTVIKLALSATTGGSGGCVSVCLFCVLCFDLWLVTSEPSSFCVASTRRTIHWFTTSDFGGQLSRPCVVAFQFRFPSWHNRFIVLPSAQESGKCECECESECEYKALDQSYQSRIGCIINYNFLPY